jgi:hypothetical protein
VVHLGDIAAEIQSPKIHWTERVVVTATLHLTVHTLGFLSEYREIRGMKINQVLEGVILLEKLPVDPIHVLSILGIDRSKATALGMVTLLVNRPTQAFERFRSLRWAEECERVALLRLAVIQGRAFHTSYCMIQSTQSIRSGLKSSPS